MSQQTMILYYIALVCRLRNVISVVIMSLAAFVYGFFA